MCLHIDIRHLYALFTQSRSQACKGALVGSGYTRTPTIRTHATSHGRPIGLSHVPYAHATQLPSPCLDPAGHLPISIALELPLLDQIAPLAIDGIEAANSSHYACHAGYTFVCRACQSSPVQPVTHKNCLLEANLPRDKYSWRSSRWTRVIQHPRLIS